MYCVVIDPVGCSASANGSATDVSFLASSDFSDASFLTDSVVAATVASFSEASFTGASFTGALVAGAADTILSPAAFGAAALTTSCFGAALDAASLGAAGVSFTASGAGISLAVGASKSILPTVVGPLRDPFALTTSAALASLAKRFSSCSFSSSILIASFSFLFSSPTSLEATFLLISVWNWSKRT